MATAPDGPRWGEIAAAVAQEIGLVNNRSPALTTATERGVRFIVVDQKASELVFDMHALFLGFLAAGQQDRQSINFGNTASWFADWLTKRIGGDQVAIALAPEQMTEPDIVFRTFAAGFKVTLSQSVRALLQSAQKIAVETNRPSEFEARHLFTAMLQGGYVVSEVARTFSVTLPPDQIQALKLELAERIMGQPAPGESAELWRQALDLPPPPPPGGGGTADTPEPDPSLPPETPPADGVSGFNRDSVATAGTDFLRTGRDAEALARLVCLDQAAPLAIAIFGDWGSGKSTFMSRLDEAIKEIARGQREDPPEEDPADGTSARFIRRVVQIRFNAWQFVDANLWASLTSEFFDQLRAGGWERVEGARHAGLVARVNSHVHSLNSDVQARRDAAAKAGKDVLKAQKEVDTAAKAAREAPGRTLGRAAIDLLNEAYDSQKDNLTALGLDVAGVDSGKAVSAIVTSAKAGSSIWRQAVAVVQVVAKSPLRAFLVVASLLALGGAAWWIWWEGFTTTDLVPAFVALGALGTAATAMLPALKVVGAIAKRSADIAKQIGEADRETLKDLLAAEVALRDTTAEAEALAAAAQRSSGQLARYVSPDGTANPPRLLRYVLEDDPDTKALQAEIGLIGRTRRLFQAVDDIARQERKHPETVDPDEAAPDRIVLYIDDLDRCTDEQVYNVLQAIHLLLAFELFVVVVGVDVKRVRTALARALRPREAIDEDDDAVAQLAASYLEKIFQIAFWLAPLSAEGDDGGSYARYVKGLAGPAAKTGAAAPATDAVAPAAAPAESARPAEAAAAEEAAQPDAGTATAAEVDALAAIIVSRRKALATIELSDVEVAFLASKEIAAVAAATPRAVKRLINVYRLVRTRLSDDGVSILGGGGKPPAYPLIALMVAIETGQTVEVADDFHQALHALNPATSLLRPGAATAAAKDAAIKALLATYKATPALQAAATAAAKLRGNSLEAGDLLPVARVVRRYSFNAGH